MPKSLKQQLRYAVFKPTLDRHRFFSTVETLHASTTRELCDEAVEFTLLRAEEDLFVPGGEGDASFCTMEGDMVYLQDPNTSPAMGFTRDLVKVGSWMCEAALWVHWTHVGRATSVHPCKILVVHAEPLIRNLKKHRLVQQFSRGYSNQFYKCVCASRPPLNKWPTDLFVANTDFSEMVVALPQDIRTAIGLHVLENRGEGDKLQNEVLQGTSSLVPTENGGGTARRPRGCVPHTT